MTDINEHERRAVGAVSAGAKPGSGQVAEGLNTESLNTEGLNGWAADGRSGEPSAPAPGEQRGALVRLLVVLAALAVLTVWRGATATVLVVLAFVAMIMLHELGHFLTAKWAGMKVTEYFLGFGPRLWSIRKGETEYGIKAIPAGGYVKIIGMSNLEPVDPADEHRTYRQQPYWRRLSVAVAGSTVHFIIALVLLIVLNGVVGVVRNDGEPLPVVDSISRLETGQSPAEQAGLQVGDRIVAVDGQPFSRWEEIRNRIRQSPGQPLTLEVERDGRGQTLTATPVDLSTVQVQGVPAATESVGFLGVSPAYPVERAGPLVAVGRSVRQFGQLGWQSITGITQIFSPGGVRAYSELVTRGPASAQPSPDEPRFLSPVGFVRVASQAAGAGIRPVLLLLVLINIFVGVFNLIPLLPFDGGHVAIATYERLRSRRGHRHYADLTKYMPVAYAVVLMLVFIGVSSLYLDIRNPLANPFQ